MKQSAGDVLSGRMLLYLGALGSTQVDKKVNNK